MVALLYGRYFRELVNYMTRSAGGKAAAEDIVQEAFLRALEHSDQLEKLDEKQGRAWLYRTAKNILIDRARRKREEPFTDGQGTYSEDFSGAMVMQLCGYLEPQERAMFWLRYFEDYNASEIGEVFGLPASTVRSKLLAARKKLQKYFPELKMKE